MSAHGFAIGDYILIVFVDGASEAVVAAGRINTIVLYVGANDFAIWNNTYANIYNGVLAGQSLKDYINRIVSSVAIAIDTVRATKAVNMIVTNPARVLFLLPTFLIRPSGRQ